MSHKFPKPTKNELETTYNDFKSISKVSRHYGTSNTTVRSWLIYYDIERYTHKESCMYETHSKKIQMPDKNELESIYKITSIKDIEELYGVGQATIYQWLDHHKIKHISISQKVSEAKQEAFNNRFFQLSKEQIEKDYTTYQCMGSLANHYKCSMTTMKKLFKIYDVEAKFAKSSVGQNEVANFISSLGLHIEQNNRKIISPLELDIVIPEKKIAIEYCGNYFHSQTWGNKHPKYHRIKYEKCRDAGYKLIMIFESEWKKKQDIIKSILRHKMGKTETRIYARNTDFRELTYQDIKQFEKDNHLQWTRPAFKYYGLFYKNELIMSASIGKARFNKKYKYELIRMTAKMNTHLIGGVSKLFKNMQIKDCVTYADNRFGDGATYEKVGFTKLGESAPNYFYFHKSDHHTLHSRNKFQKHKILNVDKTKTEYENMLGQGYDRIFDCGNSIYGVL